MCWKSGDLTKLEALPYLLIAVRQLQTGGDCTWPVYLAELLGKSNTEIVVNCQTLYNSEVTLLNTRIRSLYLTHSL